MAFLLVVALGTRLVSRGPLAPPSLGDPASWAGWAAERSPLEAAFAVLGLVVEVLAWYLLGATVLAAAARRRGAGRLVSVAEVLTLPVLRRAVHAALGLSVAGSSAAGLASAAVDPAPPRAWRVPTGVELVVATAGAPFPLDDESGGDGGSTGAGAGEPDRPGGGAQAPTMRRLPPSEAEGGETPTGEAPTAEAPTSEVPAREAPTSEAPTPGAATGGTASDEAPPSRLPTVDREVTAGKWELRPGDHLWSVASQVVEAAVGRPPHDHEVATYWRRLIEVNLDRLADPANPDLVFPGQVLAVP
ncbi:MAG: LysM peptidoglycan-binding domain-containing protein, partial [Actinomycetota bacterium]|nr:LysM peptidoglycan-binding domain-containing protein [Actinomycetota bacterium]